MPFFSRFLIAVVVLVVAALGLAAETRTWTSGKYKIEAEFVGLTDDGSKAILRTTRGESKVPLTKLSQNDRDWIDAHTATNTEDEDNPFAELISDPAQTSDVSKNLTVVPKDCVKRALLIGVNDYAKFTDLKYAVADVELICEKLLELGFKPENIVELKTGASSEFLPTKANIEERLDALFTESGADDMIFIDFSGHGFEIDGVAGFAPQDARPSGDANVIDIASAVSITDVMKRLKENESKFKWLVVDACRENPTLTKNASTSARALKPLDPPPGIVVLQSCGPTEYSFEDAKSGHGLFTSKLAEALDGKADSDDDGVITILDVVQYATTETIAAAKRDFSSVQTPFFKADITNFTLADDLKRDGLTRSERRMGESLLAAADDDVKADEYESALAKIDEALKLNPIGATLDAWIAKRDDVETAREKSQSAVATAKEAEALRAFKSKKYGVALKAINLSIELESTSERIELKKEIEDAMRDPTAMNLPNFSFPTEQIQISTTAELESAFSKLHDEENFDNVTLVLAKGRYSLSHSWFVKNKTLAICGETGKPEDVQLVFPDGDIISCEGDSAVALVGLDISAGIPLIASEDAYVVARNCCFRNGRSGLSIFGNAIIDVENCEIANYEDVGVSISWTARLEMRECYIHDGGNEGIFLTDSSTANVSDCEIANNEYEGVYVSGSARLEMRGCDIHDSWRNGIYLWKSSTANVSDCKICNKGGQGVYVDGDKSQSGVFRNNRLSGNHKHNDDDKSANWNDVALKRLTRIGNTPNE